jgi:hypothetical protein
MIWGVKIASVVRVVARFGVSVGCALGVVWVASRVNRPARWAVVEVTPRVADLVLADVRWDPTSFRSAIESVRRAAPAGAVVVDWESLRELNEPAEPRYRRPVVRLRNVRVGTLVRLSFDSFTNDHASVIRQEGGRILVGGPGTLQPVTTRLYDLRHFLGSVAGDDAEWEYAADGVAESLRNRVFSFPAEGSSAGGCGRWLVVSSTDAGHRAVEEYLLLIGGEAGGR